jgi:hypothetical protein
MNFASAFAPMKSAFRQVFVLTLLAATFTSDMLGQAAITSWTTTTLTDSADQTVSGITYLNKFITVDTFTTAGGTYFAQSSVVQADDAYVRRNTTTQSNGVGWMAIRNGSNTNVHGSYYATEKSLLLSGNLLNSTFDTFTNDTGTLSGQATNVERIDFVWSSGYTALSGDVLTVFNIDPAGAQDNFRIAVFTGWDSVNHKPTSYATTGVLVVDGQYGPLLSLAYPTGTSTTSTWNAVSFTSGDSLSGTGSFVFTQTPQGIGGAAISLTDLGVGNGQTIYGYSIMGPDVTPTTAADLVDWTNSSVYLTNTSQVDGTADFSTFGGRFVRPIPEPSAYGTILLGAGLLAFGVRRRFSRRADAARGSAPPTPARTAAGR